MARHKKFKLDVWDILLFFVVIIGLVFTIIGYNPNATGMQRTLGYISSVVIIAPVGTILFRKAFNRSKFSR
jgi:Na+/melibiose symporter-like transporter